MGNTAMLFLWVSVQTGFSKGEIGIGWEEFEGGI